MWTPTAWLFSYTIATLGPAAHAAPTAATVPMTAPPKPPVASPQLAARTASSTSSGSGSAPSKPAPPAAPSGKQLGEVPVAEVVARLQQAYDGTQDFEARFTQRFTYTLLRRTQESRGQVRFQKPGRMRWDYENPTPKSFIVDGKSLWIFQPQEKTAMVNACFQQDGLTASVAFLWGAGKIDEQFSVQRFPGVFSVPTDIHLELQPKEPNGVFAKLILALDPESYRVKQSVVIDVQGNVNQFIYDEMKFNRGTTSSAFTFTPPEGTLVSPMPGSCAARP